MYGPHIEIAMDNPQKIMEILVQTEQVADQILQNKQEIVALDKRRQSTREALRDLKKSDETKTWITIGSLLIKVDKKKGLDLLKRGYSIYYFNIYFPIVMGRVFWDFITDQIQIDVEINKLRSDQKVLVCELRDLEHLQPAKGFDLKPMSNAEISAIRSNLPGF